MVKINLHYNQLLTIYSAGLLIQEEYITLNLVKRIKYLSGTVNYI